VPAVHIGSRQNNRLHAENVLFTKNDKASIKEAIRAQISRGKYEPSRVYYSINTSKKIADKLAGVKLYIQKEFIE
jgi:hypothetical protein